MGNCNCNEPAAVQMPLRILGAITLLVGIIQFGIDLGTAKYLSNVHLGAYWAAIFTALTGLLGAFSKTRGFVIGCCIISVFGIIIGIIGTTVDGIASKVISELETCASGPSSGNLNDIVFYGNTAANYEAGAFGCYATYFQNAYDCYCVSSAYTYSYVYDDNFASMTPISLPTSGPVIHPTSAPVPQPTLSPTNPNDVCFLYNGQTNCENILTDYKRMLKAATAFDAIGLIFVFALSITTCVSLCCPDRAGGAATSSAAGPPAATVVVIETGKAPMATAEVIN